MDDDYYSHPVIIAATVGRMLVRTECITGDGLVRLLREGEIIETKEVWAVRKVVFLDL